MRSSQIICVNRAKGKVLRMAKGVVIPPPPLHKDALDDAASKNPPYDGSSGGFLVL